MIQQTEGKYSRIYIQLAKIKCHNLFRKAASGYRSLTKYFIFTRPIEFDHSLKPSNKFLLLNMASKYNQTMWVMPGRKDKSSTLAYLTRITQPKPPVSNRPWPLPTILSKAGSDCYILADFICCLVYQYRLQNLVAYFYSLSLTTN